MSISAAQFIKWLEVFGIAFGPANQVQSISAATTLTASAFGKTFLVTGSSYTITLPAASAGTKKQINFIFQPNPGALITIAPTIGSANYIYGANESASFFTTGSAWMLLAQQILDLEYEIGLVATQSNGVVVWDTLVKSVHNGISYGAGVFTPNYPGTYTANAQLNFSANPNGASLGITASSTATPATSVTASDTDMIQGFYNVYCNGAGNSFSLTFNGSTAVNIGGRSDQNFIRVKRVGNL